jgi:hypothetical protein
MLVFDQFYQPSAQTTIEHDPAQLLPQLLNQLIILGQMAQELSYALGGNGHRAEKAAELIQKLVNERR